MILTKFINISAFLTILIRKKTSFKTINGITGHLHTDGGFRLISDENSSFTNIKLKNQKN